MGNAELTYNPSMTLEETGVDNDENKENPISPQAPTVFPRGLSPRALGLGLGAEVGRRRRTSPASCGCCCCSTQL
jgi:hypothetical protein